MKTLYELVAERFIEACNKYDLRLNAESYAAQQMEKWSPAELLWEISEALETWKAENKHD